MQIIGIIPARYASSRFPGKPLAMIKGKTMIQHVYENASKAKSLIQILVATDDRRIYDAVIEFGGKALMTSIEHQSGTDRCNEVLQSLKKQGKQFEVAINIQGDEPFLNHAQIESIAQCFKDKPDTQISTLVKKIQHSEELFNPNVVKAVVNLAGDAIWFSRSPIPFMRNLDQNRWVEQHVYYKHIGIYGFRTEVLEKITNLGQTKMEIAESLEQLRWIENGYRIKTSITAFENMAVDKPEDLEKITNII